MSCLMSIHGIAERPINILADLLVGPGPECSNSPAFLRLILSELKESPSEHDVAVAMLGMLRAGDAWNIETVVKVIRESVPSLNWHKVLESLDNEDFSLDSSNSLDLILRAWVAAADDVIFPVALFFGTWKHVKGQLSFLHRIITATVHQAELLRRVIPQEKRIINHGDFAFCSYSMNTLAVHLADCHLNSFDLVECVVRIAVDYDSDEAKQCLAELNDRTPELVLLTLAQSKSGVHDYFKIFLRQWLHRDPLTLVESGVLMLAKLYDDDIDLFHYSLIELHGKNEALISGILDFIQEPKALHSVLNRTPLSIALDLVAHASRRHDMDLERWLESKVKEQQDVFIHACLEFLVRKLSLAGQLNLDMPFTAPLLPQTQQSFLNVLSKSPMSADTQKRLTDIQHLVNIQKYEPSAVLQFGLVYERKLAVADFVIHLTTLRGSNDPEERGLFNYMIYMHLDEFRFFSQYPCQKLHVAAEIFGYVIQHSLVQDRQLETAMEYVLQALKYPPDSEMHRFGVQALYHFRTRIHEWPSFCALLLQVPSLQQTSPAFCKFVETLLHGVLPPSARPSVPSFPIDTTIMHLSNSSIVNDLGLPKENEGTSKANDLREYLQPENFELFSKHLVRRIIVEPDAHIQYQLLINVFNNALLGQHILQETIGQIKELLSPKEAPTGASEQSNLQFLGSWLGRITLAKDRPIKHKHIAFKQLLLAGYDSNHLSVVIPFVCKVLEQCQSSRVFRPPNPWLMAIVGLLRELFQTDHLDAFLKHQIEALFNLLSLQMKDVEASSLLKSRVLGGSLPHADIGLAREEATTRSNESSSISAMSAVKQLGVALRKLSASIVLDPELVLRTTPLQNSSGIVLAHWVAVTLTKHIVHITQPKVLAAVESTRALVIKDFALETNENTVRNAAHVMAGNLAGNLAEVMVKAHHAKLVPCLTELFVAHRLPLNYAEEAAIQVLNENAELLNNYTRVLASNDAKWKVDKEISKLFSSPRQSKSQSGHSPVFESRASSKTRWLPEELKTPQPHVYSRFGERRPVGKVLQWFEQDVLQVLEDVYTNNGETGSVQLLTRVASNLKELARVADTAEDTDKIVLTCVQMVIPLLHKNGSQYEVEVYAKLLKLLLNLSTDLSREMTKRFTCADTIESRNVGITIALIEVGLIDRSIYDTRLAARLDNEWDPQKRALVIEFSNRLMKSIFTQHPPLVTAQGFAATVEALNNVRAESRLHEYAQQFCEYFRLCQGSYGIEKDKTRAMCATRLVQSHLFDDEDQASLFFRLCIEHAFEKRACTFDGTSPFEALAILVVDLLHHSDTKDKVELLRQALRVVVLFVAQCQHLDQDIVQKPFVLFFTSLFGHLYVSEQQQQASQLYLDVLHTIGDTLITLGPSYFPGFTAAWFKLMSHRHFMMQLLMYQDKAGWSMVEKLVGSLLEFIAPFMEKGEMDDMIQVLYRGTLRILFVLLHSFPDFLCEYHLAFCHRIPVCCIQLRNLILSASPSHMALPNPDEPDLKVDCLPEMYEAPRVRSDYIGPLEAIGIKADLDAYLASQTQIGLLSGLLEKLVRSSAEHRVLAIHALVFYVGSLDTALPREQQYKASHDIFRYLATVLDMEGRFLLINAIADQLRFPNSHTHYFSRVMLCLFAESKDEEVKEQIARVLLERVIVRRPHPWGLVITCIELLKNKRYDFWQHSFANYEIKEICKLLPPLTTKGHEMEKHQ